MSWAAPRIRFHPSIHPSYPPYLRKPVESMLTKKTFTGSHCTATLQSNLVPSSMTPSALDPSTSTTAQMLYREAKGVAPGIAV